MGDINPQNASGFNSRTTKKLPQKFVNTLEKIQKDFIWKKDKPKIKHATKRADYIEGRYKDVHMNSKMTASKIIWKRRLTDEDLCWWRLLLI